MQSIATPRKPVSRFVLFGATGDLARRMIWPSLYHLERDRLLPESLGIVAAVRRSTGEAELRDTVVAALREFLAAELLVDDSIGTLLKRVVHAHAEFRDDGSLDPADLAGLRARIGPEHDAVYFASLAPRWYGAVSRALGEAGLAHAGARIVLEKPIGHDHASSRRINEDVGAVFSEERILRVDHYLGKDTVQNLLALRFANSLFEPLWNSAAIDHVQITVAETVGVEGRWSYYDESGALRDMIQNHLLQLVALVAMEPPSSFDPLAVRNEKTKVLQSLRPIRAQDVDSRTVRGQYTAGVAGGKAVAGYREEQGARNDSGTETFVALRAEIDNWRWAGVPFYLRTGKRLQARRSDIVIQFRQVPHNIFASHRATLPPNRMVIRLQPEERITLEVMGKRPGLDGVQLAAVPLELSLRDAFGSARSRIAYERLLLDALRGNGTLFVRRDEIEAAWQWIDGIQSVWRDDAQGLRPYPAGSWGPTAAIALTERNGHSWYE
jgi:glucose-6-phosphate 1-dehydrogenase